MSRHQEEPKNEQRDEEVWFKITDEQISPKLKDKVVVVTGCSSGIGLATTELLLGYGAKVIGGDRSPFPFPSTAETTTVTSDNSNDDKYANLRFKTTDVASWNSLTALFEFAATAFNETDDDNNDNNNNTAQNEQPNRVVRGKIDHVFANAGIGGRTNLLTLETDPVTHQLIEPNHTVFDINLRGVINTSALAFHYMQKQQQQQHQTSPSTSTLASTNAEEETDEEQQSYSVVMTASASSFQRFVMVDYASAKHGVLGFMRGMVPVLKMAKSSIRVNAVAPSWTRTGLVPEGVVEAAGKETQSAEAAARSVLVLMADGSRNGQLMYSEAGKYREIDEAVLLKANRQILGDGPDDNIIMERILNAVMKKGIT